MFAKRLLQKALPQHTSQHASVASSDMQLQVALHYGIPYTASILAFDPIQRLLAIGTLDGRIKIVGGDNIEGLLISPKKLPYKCIEFAHNQGILVGVTNENDIQVWDLECRQLAYSLQWEANITAFAVIHGTSLMYIGDDNGLLSVLKYESEDGKLLRLPYHIPQESIIESAGIPYLNHQQPIVGILPQPCTSGTRVLIAYENGILILWDVSEGHVITVKGYTDLQLRNEEGVDSPTEENNELQGNAVDHVQEEREICSLCWATSNGSILAVGYINGDILLWDLSSYSSTKGKQAGLSSKSVVKLQLASGDRRLPVIVLHWSTNSGANNVNRGQLFIYGGDDMGSEEVLTVLSLEWFSGIDTLRCISRADLNLNGSFADMILIPKAGDTEHISTAALFVLTNPGQLNVYDGAMLSMLKPEDGKLSVQAEKFPMVVPTIDPCITVTKFCLLPMGRNASKDLLEKAFVKTNGTTPTLSAGTRWPLTGGVPSEHCLSEDNGLERIYIAGYQDGSVRIWDATCPILTLMFLLDGNLPGIEMDGQSDSVSALDFCSTSMSLAVGTKCGLVRVYKLYERGNGSSFHLVSETKHEVQIVQHGKGFHCIAAFCISDSPVRTLTFAGIGDKIAVGIENGQVILLDMSSLSIMFRTDCLSGTNSPVISIAMHVVAQTSAIVNSPKHPNPENQKGNAKEVMIILTKDAHVIFIDGITGKTISSRPWHPKKESAATSMYVIEGRNVGSDVASKKTSEVLSDNETTNIDSQQSNDPSESKAEEVAQKCSSDASSSSELFSDPLIIICCEDALWSHTLKSLIQGDSNNIHKVNLVKHCCWSAIFKKRDEKACGLILLYQSGDLEIRSLPELEVLAESSLMSILRWSFKTNMDKTMSSYDNGQIALVNGCEVAFISLLSCENDFRIPESFPCLHDKVVAAAAEAAISLSMNQKRRQGTAPGIFGGIIKGLKGGRETNVDVSGSSTKLEEFFQKDPFLDPSTTTVGDNEIELSIDDIEIDEVVPLPSTSSLVNKNSNRNENAEREKLFHGATSDVKPRVRTAQEIMTQYRFAGDASAAAAHARDKLAERQQKLEMLNKRTQDLQDGAENFADMANELLRTMEKKKWWQI